MSIPQNYSAPPHALRIGRGLLAATIALFWLAAAPDMARAHEDHGNRPSATVTATQPRVTAQSETYELVGVAQGQRLTIYLDRFADNVPVTDAGLQVMIGDETVPAERNADGTYGITSPRLAASGTLELTFAITAKDGDDLLIGTLQLPERPAPVASNAPSSAVQWLRHLPDRLDDPYVFGGGLFLLGLLIGAMLRGYRLVPLAGLALLTTVALTSAAFSHGDEDHGSPAAASPAAGDTSRRLPDGSVFVPKPTQRLLEVRTTVARPQAARKAVNLIGRVITDPNRSGLVQSIGGGRVIAPDTGLPRLGQGVRKGDLLALVERPLPAADRATISEKTGDLEQQIAVAEAKLQRARQLAQKGVTAQAQVADAEIDLEGLKRRREIIRQTRAEPEVLRAPIDGVVASARVVAGQVVQAQDVLFQIVDPKGLWVEALVFGEFDPGSIAEATASATDGKPMRLAYKGSSRALQQQATVVHFEVVNPPPSLSVGQPVTVLATRKEETVPGIILPRDAVVSAGNGEAVVWRHLEPERFEARPVRTEPFDATRVVAVAGVEAGERIVTRGAELINQIR